MKIITDILSEKVSTAFAACGYAPELGVVTISDRPDLCQFQCNGAFAGAKLHRKAPAAIAGDVVASLAQDETFVKVELAGAGFINLHIADSVILAYLGDVMADAALGIPQAEEEECIVLDYGGPNVAKPLHIGHLRSAIIGESMKRIAQAVGRKTIADTHLGDWGLPMGLVIAELRERNPHWPCFAPDFDPATGEIPTINAQELNEIYPFASQKSKEDADFRDTAKGITAQLQQKHPPYYALWKEIVRVSITDMEPIYKNLNVSFDYWYGESNSADYVPVLMEQLTSQGLLREDAGAMIVDVAEEDDRAKVPPIIIKKSDNSDGYATTDLATIIQRQKDFHPGEMWYFTDNRQTLHFTQVFRCAKRAGLTPSGTKLEYLPFGTMNGSDGKPYKTRDGGVMQLSALWNQVYDAAYARTSASAFGGDADTADIAAKITVATIKFGDLINHRAKDYIFDLDKFLATDGKTGSFLLYTVARINSILKKVEGEAAAPAKAIYTQGERSLLLTLALSNEAFLRAYREKAPNIVCENAYQIAAAFSGFYHDHHILTESDPAKRAAWINACVMTKALLEKHLDALGIEAVDLM